MNISIQKKSSGKLFFWGMITTVAIIIAGYFIWQLITPGGVNFYIESPKETKSGETKALTFICENKTRLVLSNTKIKIVLPKDVLTNDYTNTAIIEIGEIAPKARVEKTFYVTSFGENASSKKIETTLEYKPSGFTSTFEKKTETSILINGSIVDLNLTTPNQVLPDSDFTINAFWNNQSNKELKELAIRMVAPSEFNMTNTDGLNEWDLGNVNALQKGKVDIVGNLGNQGGENKKFDFLIGINLKDMNEFLILNKKSAFVSMVSNPLSLKTTVNSVAVYNANIGERLTVTMNYKNNYSIALNNLTLKATLTGDYFDFKQLMPNKGYFTYANKTITWSESQIPQLATLNPGESGEITFSIPLKSSFDVKSANDKNIVLSVQTEMQSLTPPIELEANSKIKTNSSANIKIATDANLNVTGFFVDNKTTMKNCGSLPLQVNKTTCFTIHLNITNYLNELQNVAISTKLPYYVNFNNKYITNYTNADFTFDKFSKTITWKLDKIVAGSGITSKPYELIMQIEVSPTMTEVNSYPVILGQTTMTALDAFTQKQISKTVNEFSTRNLGDLNLSPNAGIVVE